MPPTAGNGIIHLSSPFSVPETAQRLQSTLQAKGIQVFAVIDHSGGAEKAGLAMHPTQLVIFGNARTGTPPMLAAPTLALDLPLKALIWQDADGKVRLSYNSSEYLMQRHNVPENAMEKLAGIGGLLQSVLDS
jgi:uncharacterized protein (DUF302 family)